MTEKKSSSDVALHDESTTVLVNTADSKPLAVKERLEDLAIKPDDVQPNDQQGLINDESQSNVGETTKNSFADKVKGVTDFLSLKETTPELEDKYNFIAVLIVYFYPIIFVLFHHFEFRVFYSENNEDFYLAWYGFFGGAIAMFGGLVSLFADFTRNSNSAAYRKKLGSSFRYVGGIFAIYGVYLRMIYSN